MNYKTFIPIFVSQMLLTHFTVKHFNTPPAPRLVNVELNPGPPTLCLNSIQNIASPRYETPTLRCTCYNCARVIRFNDGEVALVINAISTAKTEKPKFCKLRKLKNIVSPRYDRMGKKCNCVNCW